MKKSFGKTKPQFDLFYGVLLISRNQTSCDFFTHKIYHQVRS